ncbi:hypothetical protein CUR65_01580 [Salmonella enterica subsp. enterica serovar Legon]|uniref:hypothetical protein n=1 Tax=Salmonella enterica TaxID=28901 RepID=UPI000D3E1C97|nr:hypothetical protein [Salmonella enterica]EBR8050721.1 hypothetical protein [Salmonella enterica subsp. enterica serovar Altona]EBS2725003.1 hypothetical protein [Salmonella enterica subsp. enterica serovar Wangata]EBW2325385.1 hypothetical protein [Salmonella enterica subsp. enterica serovar Agoueve]EBY3809275.1 hypothetical protein [Salmonella enterica subsp. enterica serovar Adabraka]ECL8853009.1 hypothetical protein [Salmonella enterica subsp. enterica serovar Limete]ECR4402784.1 hypot
MTSKYTYLPVADYRNTIERLFRQAIVHYNACVGNAERASWRSQSIMALEITADINCKRATERDRRNFLSARERLQERVNSVLASGEVCHG